MIDKISKFTDNAIWFSYLALGIITPLIFSTKNTELFEVPKMIFVYLIATFILFLTITKFILHKRILIPKSWPLAIFLTFFAINILSTFFSIDKFTSIFGYPSRLNGGLLSTFAYFVIFAGALVNLNSEKSRKLLAAIIISAFAVTLWGIPAHFGKDPSCLVLTGKLNSACWQKEFDPTVRIFSTLGQPNWLASYLVLILPIALAFSLISVRPKIKNVFSAITLVLFTGLIMTTSRAGFLGVTIALGLMLLLLGLKTIKQNLRLLSIVFLGFTLVAVIFGTNLFSRFGEAVGKSSATDQITPQSYQPTIPQTSKTVPTESFQIRLIVWQGALEVFKKWPILGSGPETFAYSYYLFRPAAHNQTTEWNFFYNKAHNEFLNYEANVGILGTLAYLSFLSVLIWQLNKTTKDKSVGKSQVIKAAIAAVIGYQTTIFFGFSVVASQLIMFLIISSALIFSERKDVIELKLDLFKSTALGTLGLLITITAGFYVLIFVGRIYFADILINRAKNLQSSQSPVTCSNAIAIFPFTNPFYLSDCAYENALYVPNTDDSALAKALIENTKISAEKALNVSPNNLIVARKIANAYLLISTLPADRQGRDAQYAQRALDIGQRLTVLAPTDPQSYLTLGKIQAGLGLKEDAKKTLETVLNLKPDYQEAKELLEQLTSNN